MKDRLTLGMGLVKVDIKGNYAYDQQEEDFGIIQLRGYAGRRIFLGGQKLNVTKQSKKLDSLNQKYGYREAQ